MTDVSIEVVGEMEVLPMPPPKPGFQSFLQFPPQLPDAKEWVLKQRQNVRPWLQFIQTSNFKVPPSLPRLSKRIMRNIEYFQSNYLFVFLGLIAYCLITSPLLLLVIGASFFVGYKLSKRHQEQRPIIFLKDLSLTHQYGLVAICSMPVLYLAGAGAALFWVLGASFFVITLHASFYSIEALIAGDESSYGLLQDV